jgi:hypothetical protein
MHYLGAKLSDCTADSLEVALEEKIEIQVPVQAKGDWPARQFQNL